MDDTSGEAERRLDGSAFAFTLYAHPRDARSFVVGQASLSTNQEKLEKALICMETALHLLDDADAPADIGAHLDLAICRLKDTRANSPMNVPVIAPNGSSAK